MNMNVCCDIVVAQLSCMFIMESSSNWYERSKPFIAVTFLQFGFAGMDVLSKAAMNKGMSNYVLVVYRHLVAFFAIAPFALFLDKPVIDQNLYFLGMKYTTATFAAAMTNMLPAITFFMACILRLEKIKIKSIRSIAKVVGTLATVSGAMVMTLLKGPIIELFGRHGGSNHNLHHDADENTQHAIKGFIMITIGCFSWACFVILQTITLEAYPAELSLTAWICILGAAEGAAVAMIMERANPSVWYLKWDMKLLAVVYSGIVCSGLAYYMQGLVLKTRGPVFVTAFNPLCMVIVAIMGSLILAEKLFLGRLIGAIVIVLGLYLVVWGKSKDYKPPSNEPVLPAKQVTEEANTKKEHCNHHHIAISNLRAGITTLEEQA
ncbi:WAT1-related protein At2g37450 isoform X3 [Arachis ipaensis]|uniref:WAT1-related protein At2g37450 isoform X3 n=2 Tax=Arachis ipaensis TaxID=130454 RepID=UPI000A2B4D06|nr:WAT1-related protein At2g37450 isoform X3 [Arachis ipaensis]XP_029146536.1 WAT1-related protein At2g37450 isoform X2 [Arachis hypogaea]